MLTILQINRYCLSWFNYYFCENVAFKYFLMCVVVPVCFSLLLWWGPELARPFCKKCKCETQPVPETSIKDMVHEIVSTKDIERLITAAVVMGVQKFVANHPKTKETLKDILKIIKEK